MNSTEISNYEKLAQINVNGKTEKKQQHTYLSWAFAVDTLMRTDPQANWQIHPPQFYGNQVMVSCTVTAFDKPIYMWLPVMDHKSKAVDNPSVMDINKAQMRCLVKAIACHGLGLYIYAGEDLPSEPEPVPAVKETLSDERFKKAVESVKQGTFDKVRLLTQFDLTAEQYQTARGI